ncbi:MAG: VWA domain-containing protein [Terriglobales bacterium]
MPKNFRLRPVIFLMFLGSTIFGSMTCSGFAQTPVTPAELTLRANVAEVRVTFSATDQNNHVVATVQPSDLAIVDQDMVVREFRSFTRSEYTRLDVAMLVDASGSTSSYFRQELSNVVQLIAQSGGVPDESFSVVTFRDLKPSVVCDGNCRALNAAAQFPSVASGGQTPLYDSLVFGSRMLGHRAELHARKILILFSDGADTISLNSFSDAVDSALDNDVAIYSVDTSKAPHVYAGTLVLRSLAVNTGGRYLTVESGSAKVLDAVLEDFHATYTVAYKLPNHAAGFHPVRILPTRNLGLQFHCRRGYYFPSDPEN